MEELENSQTIVSLSLDLYVLNLTIPYKVVLELIFQYEEKRCALCEGQGGGGLDF